ncbi:MAG: S1C family serine protease [Acidimicrobiales bacterium]
MTFFSTADPDEGTSRNPDTAETRSEASAPPYGEALAAPPQYAQQQYGYGYGYGQYWPGSPMGGVRLSPAGASGAVPPRERIWIAIALVSALVGGLIGASVGAVVARNTEKTVVETFFPNRSVVAQPSDVQEVLAKVLPSVVSVTTQVFNPTGTASRGLVEGAGTGMIVTSQGEVLTNNHVVAGASIVSVALYGQTLERQARVIGTDPAKDLALVQIEGVHGLPTVTLGNSSSLLVGDSVLAVGNALALAGGLTVTAGIVSALNRSLEARDPITSAVEHLTGLIQTDAPINPGNSGGPLVNSQGQVVGINTAVAGSASNGYQAENIGFAIAVNQVKPLMGLLQRGGTAYPVGRTSGKPFMGVVVESVTPTLAKSSGLHVDYGAMVVQTDPGAPATVAGIRPGDVIIEVSGIRVGDAVGLTSALGGDVPGSVVSVMVERGSKRLSFSVKLDSFPVSAAP